VSQELWLGRHHALACRFFMNKFRKLGSIDYNDAGLKINNSLLSVVLRD
jgi:hypothetical protein